MRNIYTSKHYSLPPKSPFPSITPFYPDYAPTTAPKGIPKYRDGNGNSHHQRTSSESLLIEEQPSWLNELLDEPETPVKRGHRRSSSDSFTYMEAANANIEHAAQIHYRLKNTNSQSPPSWGSQDFDLYKEARNASFYVQQNPVIKNQNRGFQNSTSSQEVNKITSQINENQDTIESCTQDDLLNSKGSLETETKRAKQQFAQRSRVRKLQYIADLERNVQVLQAEGADVSAELKFLNQRSVILNMENKALKQRLENLAQEQLIKYLEHEVLEREIGRLRALYKQQQQPPPEERRDSVESQFAKLSLKNKEPDVVRDSVSGPLRI